MPSYPRLVYQGSPPVRVFNLITQPQSVGATTGQQELARWYMPPEVMGGNGMFTINFTGSVNNNANVKTFRVFWDGVTLITQNLTASLSTRLQFAIYARGLQSQISQAGTGGYGPTGTAMPTYTVDTTRETPLIITGQKVTDPADTVTLEQAQVNVFYQA